MNSLKMNLEKEIEDTKNQIQEYSNMLGEKIRISEEMSADDPDFLALKAKFEGGTLDGKPDEKPDTKPDTKPDDGKSLEKKSKDKASEARKSADKRKKGKKGISDKWYNLNEILVYNGIGLKGELELYFKAVDELKGKLENFQRTLSTLDNVIEKGLKEDMGCIAFRGAGGLLEISFLKSAGTRENFTLKSIYTGKAIPVENTIKIGV